MANALDLNLRSRAMLIDYKASSLPLWEKIGARQKVAGDGLQVAMPETATGNEVVFGGNVHAEVTGDRGTEVTGDREQRTGKTSSRLGTRGLACLACSL